ncbi:MAG TPA: hypothetical protein PKE29_02010 [Phycisphaerales bacterium]|nr:hypothetical protein [Phycisphaerales bacterium]
MPDAGIQRPLDPPRDRVLRPWTVIALVLSGAIASLGAAIGGGGSGSAWIGPPLIVLGSSCAAVCITLWVVCVLDPTRRASKGDSPTIARLVAELAEVARIAEARGVLALPGRTISVQASLFAAGAGLLVAGEAADAIRHQLSGMADAAADADSPRRARTRFVCDACPVVAMSLAFSVVLWMVVAIIREAPLGVFMPLALLGVVYGAFAIAALAVEFGDRLGNSTAENELSAALVIETLGHIRAGESADRIVERLRAYSPGLVAPAQPAPLRKAA